VSLLRSIRYLVGSRPPEPRPRRPVRW
jgi:hypothetical protein